MTILALLRLALGVVSALAGMARERQLLDAGAAKAIGESAREGLKLVASANQAAAAVDDRAEAIANDPDNLDRRS